MTPVARTEAFSRIKASLKEGGAPEQVKDVVDILQHVVQLLEKIANKRSYGDID